MRFVMGESFLIILDQADKRALPGGLGVAQTATRDPPALMRAASLRSGCCGLLKQGNGSAPAVFCHARNKWSQLSERRQGIHARYRRRAAGNRARKIAMPFGLSQIRDQARAPALQRCPVRNSTSHSATTAAINSDTADVCCLCGSLMRCSFSLL